MSKIDEKALVHALLAWADSESIYTSDKIEAAIEAYEAAKSVEQPVDSSKKRDKAFSEWWRNIRSDDVSAPTAWNACWEFCHSKRESVNQKAISLLRRYRNETPLGNQPHMIAAEIDVLLSKIEDESSK